MALDDRTVFHSFDHTGSILHFGGPEGAAVSYDAATTLHDISGIFISVLYGVHVVFMIGTGYWRHYIPSGEKFWARLQAQIIFYTAGSGRNGPHAGPTADSRFNVLQQSAYLIVVFALLPLLIATGLLYLFYPAFVPETVLGLAGLWPVALAHYALGILGAAYLVVHVYMAMLGPNAGQSPIDDGRPQPAGSKALIAEPLRSGDRGVHVPPIGTRRWPVVTQTETVRRRGAPPPK